MYILAVKEGYIQITIDTATREVELIECETGHDYKLNIDGEERTVKINPIGSIVIDTFNKLWDEYLKAGGEVKKAPYNGNRTIPLTAPFPPFWPLSGHKSEDLTINEIAYELANEGFNFRSVVYIPFNGSLTPVFEVNDPSDLYSYDRYRLQEAGIKVKQCEDCGRAFIPNTRAVRCKACRDAGMGNRKARKNFESKPGSKPIKNVMDRNRRINKKGKHKGEEYKRGKWTNEGATAGDVYFTRLNKVVDQHKSNDTPEQLEEFADQLNNLDNRYCALCKYFQSPTKNGVATEIVKKWLAEKTQFPQDEIEDMQQWIEKWENKK